MKKVILLLFISLSVNLFAQKEIKEGVIKMKMTMSSENEQVNSQLAMMGDLIMSTYFKGNNSRSEMSNTMAGENITIMNGDTGKMLLLLDNPMMGKKYREGSVKVSEEDQKNVSFTETGDSKTILGYECKGYIFTVKKDGIESKITMYTTDKIKALNQNNIALGNKSKGFPMYMITNISQAGMDMKMTIEVTDVKSEKVDDAKFKLTVPEGYSKIETPKPANID